MAVDGFAGSMKRRLLFLFLLSVGEDSAMLDSSGGFQLFVMAIRAVLLWASFVPYGYLTYNEVWWD